MQTKMEEWCQHQVTATSRCSKGFLIGGNDFRDNSFSETKDSVALKWLAEPKQAGSRWSLWLVERSSADFRNSWLAEASSSAGVRDC